MAATTYYCYWCHEPWVAHAGTPVRVGDIKVSQRPNCDCYGEYHGDHVGAPLAVLDGGSTLPVQGLRRQHRPPRTAQEQRHIDDELIVRLQEAIADAQRAADAAAAKRTIDRIDALEQSLRAALTLIETSTRREV